MKGAPLVTVTGIRGINRPAECWCVSRTNRVYQGVREVRGVDKPLYAIMCQAMWSVWAKHSRHQKENISDNDRECCYCKNKIYLYLIWEHRSKQTHSKVRLHQFHRVAGFLCHLLLDFTIRRYNSTRVALLSSFFKKTKQKTPPSPGRGVSRSGFSCELICLHGIESGSPHQHASGNYAYLMQFH